MKKINLVACVILLGIFALGLIPFSFSEKPKMPLDDVRVHIFSGNFTHTKHTITPSGKEEIEVGNFVEILAGLYPRWSIEYHSDCDCVTGVAKGQEYYAWRAPWRMDEVNIFFISLGKETTIPYKDARPYYFDEAEKIAAQVRKISQNKLQGK